MKNSEPNAVPPTCNPYHSMGTLWICNVKMNTGCPYALSFGYVFYCNNRDLHNPGEL